ncbi:MAG: hypothetical protein NE330_03855 [Lentisphaeraceae bacterium]|nr:hypothetical protein [Lentisphaeraceae bacterium]
MNFDISKLEYSKEGIDNFYWPFNREYHQISRDLFMKKLVKSFERSEFNQEELSTLRILLKWLVTEFVQWFEAQYLYNLLKNKMVVLPPQFRKLNALFGNRILDSSPFKGMSQKVPQKHKFSFVIRRLRDLKWNNYHVKNLLPANFSRDTICPMSNSLLKKRLKSTREKVKYIEIGHWFKDLEISFERLQHTSMTSKIMNIFKEVFSELKIDLTNVTEKSFENYLLQGTHLVKSSLDFIKKKKLPQKMFLTCAGNSLWPRILAEAVLTEGGKVESHDHGGGNSYVDQWQTHLVEYTAITSFYTYNHIMASKKAEFIDESLLLGSPVPTFKSLPKCLDKSISRNIKYHKKINKVMYVPTAFHGERSRLRPILSDVTYFDFQTRILGFFNDNSLEVIYKPHPEGRSYSPEGFSESFGFKTLKEPFEKIEEDFDAYLIDFICSSTTSQILKSNKPVIFIDPNYPQLHLESKELLKKRCYYLEATMTDLNRLEIDWHALKDICEQIEHSFDMEFSDLYFENT